MTAPPGDTVESSALARAAFARSAAEHARGETIARWVLSLFVVATAFGLFAFRQGWTVERGNELSFDRALFTSVNAITLTGFEQRESAGSYKIGGQITILGLVAVGTVASFIAGGLAVVRMTGMRFTNGQVIRAAIAWPIVAAIVGGALLPAPGDRDWFASMFQGIGALGNSGIVIGSLPGAYDWRFHVVLLPLAILGGLGLPVLMELLDALRLRHRGLSPHSRVAIGMSASVYAIGATILLVMWILTSDWPALSARDSLIASSTAALNARTFGLPGVSAELLLSRPIQWVIVLLMMIGASPAGSGGGIKVTTLAVFGAGIRDAMHGRAGRALGFAAIWVGSYLAIVVVAFIALLAAQPQMPADRLFFLTVSAMSNVGLAHDPIGITGAGLHVLSLTMLLGRLAPLGMLWWAAKTTDGLEIAAA